MEILNSITAFLLSESRSLKIIRFFVLFLLCIAVLLSASEISKKALTALGYGIHDELAIDNSLESDTLNIEEQLGNMPVPPLFGVPEIKAPQVRLPPPKTSTINTHKTEHSEFRHNLILRGIIGSVAKSQALALINITGSQGEDAIFGIGETVPGGFVLKKIYSDHVVLSFDGKEEPLYIEEKKKAKVSAVTPRPVTPRKKIVTRETDKHFNIAANEIKKALSDFGSLTKRLGVQIYKEQALQKGYRLTSQDERFLQELGLHSGDVVMEVNEIKLLNNRLGIKALATLRKESNIRLVIKRNGVRQKLTYTIQ